MSAPATIAAMADAYQAWAESYYLDPDGKPTGEHTNIKDALRALRETGGPLPPERLRAELLLEVQQHLIGQKISRKVINARINRLRRFARWCMSPPRRWLETAVEADLRLVPPLRRNRSKAPERPEREPVPWERVAAALTECRLDVATMIELQWQTGMRPGEVCRMVRSWIRFEKTKDKHEYAIYQPLRHKSAHAGKRKVIVFAGDALRLLRQWLRLVPATQEKLFDLTPNGYYQAIRRACRRAKLDKTWYPYQLRHAAGTNIAAAGGLELAKLALGHSDIRTTQIYAKPNIEALVKYAERPA